MKETTSKKPKKDIVIINKKITKKIGVEIYSPKLPKKIIRKNGTKNK